ncbi:MAG: ethanolamine ammonia-lyase subunit EutC [Ilumatobacter sp.]|uniref:ethanolamine ammonia-lyase subunit EutC n=1 Tax=Ilumatobacter sp. TaxID=1967498 RepID=UPI0032980951
MSRADARLTAREVTRARIFLDGPGTSYSTADLLRLRADHAAAQDAVHAELTLDDPALRRLVAEFGLFGVSTRATSRADYLADPESGRSLDDDAREKVARWFATGTDLQVVLGDGLSPQAVARYGPEMLESLHEAADRRGWNVGLPFLVSRCRVGVLNDVGDLLRPAIVVLLIGERPGLQTAESMSAYMAYRPESGHTDADRNLVCNIHETGTAPVDAARRVIALAEQMFATGTSGVALKEQVVPPDRLHP